MAFEIDLKKPSGEIPTSSMADVAFLLLVFFVLTATFAASRGLDFHLADEPDVPVVETTESVLVEILADASLRVDGRAMVLGDLLAYLSPKLAHNPDKPVILRPADDAPYGAMVAVFDELRGARERLDLDHDVAVALPTRREIAAFWR